MMRFLILCFAFLLLGCQPDIDVKFSTSDVELVASKNQTIMIEFEARIEDKFTTIDDKKRAEVKNIANVIGKYFKDVEIETTFAAKGFEIEIEGELELAPQSSDDQAPWFFRVTSYSNDNYLVSLDRTKLWDGFNAELKQISFFAEPDEYLPLNIKLKNDGGQQVLVGGIIIDGTPIGGFGAINLDGSRVTLSFDGDHWKKAPASFYLSTSGSQN